MSDSEVRCTTWEKFHFSDWEMSVASPMRAYSRSAPFSPPQAPKNLTGARVARPYADGSRQSNCSKRYEIASFMPIQHTS